MVLEGESLQKTHPIIFSNRSQVGVGSKLFFHDLWGGFQYKMLAVQLNGVNKFLINNGTYNGSLLAGICHHVAVSRKSDTLYFYADGALIYQNTLAGNSSIS